MKSKYPLIKSTLNTPHSFCIFIQLKDIKAKGVMDTLTVYDEGNLEIWVDVDKDNKPSGIEIIYMKDEKG